MDNGDPNKRAIITETRFAKIETDLTSIENKFDQKFNTLSSNLTSLDHSVRSWFERFEGKWDQANNAREQDRKSRQLTLPGIATIVGVAVATTIAFMTGIGSYIDNRVAINSDTMNTSITQLTERQNATSNAALARNEQMERIGNDVSATNSRLAELSKVIAENDVRSRKSSEDINKLDNDLIKFQTRQRANEEYYKEILMYRDKLDMREKELRDAKDTGIQHELRSFKERVQKYDE